ncbi:MAG: D-alanyl-D-alanine carboxypeptidase [Candidatus Vogelbacteria bacterium]|nr:D-alanyl-D-alanine carboxypeptidase [Candidatus Vogelbacteria bacterium]
MKQIIKNHKTKVIIIMPILLIVILSFFAAYIINTGLSEPNSQRDNREKTALRVFDDIKLQAKAFKVYNIGTNRTIFSRNEMVQLPLASLTKIMSALVALDIAPRETLIDATGLDGITHEWRLDDLLKLTLVASSNSDISTIANVLTTKFKIPGGNSGFITLMNRKARELNLNQTFFINESGLDVNKNFAGSYGSVNDVVKLLNFAIKKNPDIFGSTRFHVLNIMSMDGVPESVNNTNTSVSKIQGIIASKTGLTDLAGGNLAIAFDVDKTNRIIIAVLGSTQEGRFADVQTLSSTTLDYFSKI